MTNLFLNANAGIVFGIFLVLVSHNHSILWWSRESPEDRQGLLSLLFPCSSQTYFFTFSQLHIHIKSSEKTLPLHSWRICHLHWCFLPEMSSYNDHLLDHGIVLLTIQFTSFLHSQISSKTSPSLCTWPLKQPLPWQYSKTLSFQGLF